LASPAGKELLAAPLALGTREVRLADVERWTGLKLDEIDHVMLGAEADRLTSATLVVRSRRPYDEARVRQALKAQKKASPDRALYQVSIAGWPAAAVWCADDRPLVFGLTVADLEKLRRSEGAEALAEPVRSLLQERVGAAGPLWLAGHADRWDQGMPLI